MVKAVKEGEATISATSNDGSNIKSSVKVIVSKIGVSSVTLDHSKAITEVGDNTKISASISPSNATYKTITWTSSDTSVATVSSSGVVTGKGAGSATLKAVADGKSVSIPIYVTKAGDKLYAIDVNDNDAAYGDSMIIQSRDSSGKKIYGLIDTGVSSKANRVISYLNDLGITKLDFALITHFHSDHYGGLKEIYSSGVKIDSVYIKEYANHDSKYSSTSVNNTVEKYRAARLIDWTSFYNIVKSNSVVKFVGKSNNSIVFGNFNFKLYNVEQVFSNMISVCTSSALCDENVNSIVALVTINGQSIYLNSDIQNYYSTITPSDKKDYMYNLEKGIMSDNNLTSFSIVKAAHHGCIDNNPVNVIKQLNSKYVFVTNYKDFIINNKHKTLENLLSAGVSEKNIYYSGDGTVVFNIGSDKNISVLQFSGEGCNKVAGCS